MKVMFKVCLAILYLACVHAAPRNPRHTVAEYVPAYYFNDMDGAMYSFGFDVSDPVTGNTQFRSEQRYSNGTVTGRYGYIDPSGSPQVYRYIADHNGYRVYSDVSTNTPQMLAQYGNEPTESSVTWTRPPKSNKKKVTDFVSKLGKLFTKSYFK